MNKVPSASAGASRGCPSAHPGPPSWVTANSTLPRTSIRVPYATVSVWQPRAYQSEFPSVMVPPVPPGIGWVGESFTRIDRGLARDLSQHDSDSLEPGLPLLVPVGKLVPAFFVFCSCRQACLSTPSYPTFSICVSILKLNLLLLRSRVSGSPPPHITFRPDIHPGEQIIPLASAGASRGCPRPILGPHPG